MRKAAGLNKDAGQLLAVVDLLAGATVKPSALLNMDIPREDDKGVSFKGDFESKEAELADLLGEDMQLIYRIKRIYDWSILDELRSGEKYLSDAKVKVYEQHQSELRELKSLFRVDVKAYKEMFRAARKNLDNYSAYSGHGARNYRCDYDKFSAYARKQLKALNGKLDKEQKKTAERVAEGLEMGLYLGKQTSKNNGVIPHQLHEQELQSIVERASAYLPFLNEIDDSGLALKQRIMEMFRFRIPYYVGPLNSRSEKSWIVRGSEKIYPWNFEQVVDLEKSADRFITRMTATCSYIGEHVLPKDSLLYSRFVALNMINKIRVNDKLISVENKQRLFNEHLLVRGKGNFQSVKNYMLSVGIMQKGDELSGIDKEFKVSLAGYKVFERILGKENTTMMVEDIIRHIVLFGEDRKLFERWLKKEYGKALSEDDQKYVLQKRSAFKGWGSLSEQFLTEIKHADKETGELISIIDMLWQKNDNLMELLSDRYTFTEAIETYREVKFGSKNRKLDDVLKDSYASPAIRRSIHQAMGIISEIEKIMRDKPKRVFIEVTRGEGEKKRTVSRKRQLDELYASCKKLAPDVYDQLQGYDEAALRSAKLYLYFTQMGKCMYSGEPIDLSRLAIDYDIDHIYPQKRVKDDSFTNRVLVKKQLNAMKSDKYPIPDDIRINPRVRDLWKTLREKRFINEEKYRRLTRNTPFEDNELSGFIARQLVETSQACKIVAQLLKHRYGDDRVVYVKAGNVSSFRQDQRILVDGTQAQAYACKGILTKQDPLFVKCREVNDFHHAKDAYLNIVVGNVYHVKFTRNPMNFIRGKQEYSLNRMFDWDVVRNGECAWRKGNEGSIAMVRKMMRKNNILFTRYAHEVSGGLFDQMIVPKGSGQAMIKSSDPRMTTEKYGGYNKLTGAYFCLVEHTEKKKRVRSIEAVMLMYKGLYEKNPSAYCERILDLKEPRVLIKKILINSLVSLDGFRMHVSGRTGSQIIYKNANQLAIAPEEMEYIKRIAKYLERCRNARTDLPLTAFDAIDEETNKSMYMLLLNKIGTVRYSKKYATAGKTIAEQQDKFCTLSVSDQCRILIQILNLFNTTAASADLKILCGKAGIGILLTSKNLINYLGSEFKIIHQSITGVFEQEIDLMGEFA